MTVFYKTRKRGRRDRQVRHREAPRAFRVFTVPYRKGGRTQTPSSPWSKYRRGADIGES